jgi:hypothetical protein
MYLLVYFVYFNHFLKNQKNFYVDFQTKDLKQQNFLLLNLRAQMMLRLRVSSEELNYTKRKYINNILKKTKIEKKIKKEKK